MASSTRPTKRAIIKALKSVQKASIKEIATAIGPEWLEPKMNAHLRKMLWRLAQSGILNSVSHGVYALSPSHSWRGVDNRDRTEAAIIRIMRDRGGVVRRREINAVLGNTPLVDSVLKERFWQDYGWGWWNLGDLELEELPKLGRWVPYEDDDPAAYFGAVGSAFMDARARVGMSLHDVSASPAISDALLAMGEAAPSARREALAGLQAEVEEEAQAEGITERWVISERVRKRKATELAAHLYAAFEMGDSALHRVAPVEFYRACAVLFGVDAAKLSRGFVEHICQPIAAE